MKDAIQTSTEDVSIVIYDAPLPPRYLKFSKKFIRTLFIVAPILIGLVFLTLISLILTPKLKNTPRPNIPSVMSGDDSKNLELETELKNLQASYNLVQKKLSSQKSPDSNQDDIYLMGILRPYGMQNFLSQSRVTLDQFEFVPGPEKTSFKFQIISKNPENKVKFFGLYTDNIGYVDVSYNNTTTFRKEYVLEGNKISFEKDRKSTKPAGRYKSDSGITLWDLADGDTYVRRGMKGDIVKQIQHKLLKSGQLKNTYKLAANNQKCIDEYTYCHGTFGSKTYAAVQEFQDANDLVVDGIVGPDTADALRNV